QRRAVALGEGEMCRDAALRQQVPRGRLGEPPPLGIEAEERQPGAKGCRVEELVFERVFAGAAERAADELAVARSGVHAAGLAQELLAGRPLELPPEDPRPLQ